MTRKIALSLALSVMLLFAVGCTESQIKLCAKAAAGVADGLRTVEDENELLFNAKKIDADEARGIATAVTTGTHANDAFVGCVKGIKGSAGSQQAQAVACFKELTDSLSKVEADVLHVKNPESQQALALAFKSVQTALTAIRAFLPQS